MTHPAADTSLLRLLAAKSDPSDGERWLPLWVHARDTAEIMRRLAGSWLPQAVRRWFADGEPLYRVDEAALIAAAGFLGWTHDLGKATVLFQSRIMQNIPAARERLEKATTLPALKAFPAGGRTPHARASEAILLSLGCPPGIASVAGAHHGAPQPGDKDYIDEQLTNYPDNYWANGDEALWQNAWKELAGLALADCGLGSVEELPRLTVPEEMLLTGLLTMADWIASNPGYFPLMSVQTPLDPAAYPPGRAKSGWQALSLTAPWESAERRMDEEAFRAIFGFWPNEVQRAALETAGRMEQPGLMILEAPMGCGKTEAALAAAQVLAARFGCGGLFFGLPTQATANGIFPRLEDWACRQGDQLLHSVRLAHGAAELNDEYQALFHGTARTQEDGGDGGLLVHPWFQGNRQSLLADFVVATVDQLLLAALKQKHLALRQLGLAGKVVIVDECHAYDAYMNCYLDAALSWLGAYQVPVILLSATLPAGRREALAAAYRNGKTQPEAGGQPTDAYPLITWTDGQTSGRRIIPWQGQDRQVRIETVTEPELAGRLKDGLRDGGCAGVIVNTVKKAQALAGALRREMPGHTVLLVHSQFLLPDRTARERLLQERLGRSSAPEKRDKLIVVGTQVLEQSLDIDFDLLLCELCPMDLLLQRIGRLHRHRRQRPQPLRDARCLVLDTGSEELDAGSAAVYGEWLLWRTRRLLPRSITLPGDISPLVQQAYDPACPEGLAPRQERWRQKHREKEGSRRGKARPFALWLPPASRREAANVLDGLLDVQAIRSDDGARAAVRDGDMGLEVILLRQRGDGAVCFLPWQQQGGEVPVDRPPSWQESRAIARQKLRLPGWFSRRWNIDTVIRELETGTGRVFAEWQSAPLLAGELVLLLNEDLTAVLAGMTLRYDRENGLSYEKEEDDEG